MLDRQNEPLGPNAEDDVAILARKVDYLGRSDSHISAPETVIMREAHMSRVFMASDRVYKLKKPVRFPRFFDARAAGYSLSRGGLLNGRLARDVYLGVVPLSVTTTGYAIGGCEAPP